MRIGPATQAWLFEKGVLLTVWAGTVFLFSLIPGYITEHGNLKNLVKWSEEMKKTGEYSLVTAVVAIDALGKFVAAMLLKERRRERVSATILLFTTLTIVFLAMADYTMAKSASEETGHAFGYLLIAIVMGFFATIWAGN